MKNLVSKGLMLAGFGLMLNAGVTTAQESEIVKDLTVQAAGSQYQMTFKQNMITNSGSDWLHFNYDKAGKNYFMFGNVNKMNPISGAYPGPYNPQTALVVEGKIGAGAMAETALHGRSLVSRNQLTLEYYDDAEGNMYKTYLGSGENGFNIIADPILRNQYDLTVEKNGNVKVYNNMGIGTGANPGKALTVFGKEEGAQAVLALQKNGGAGNSVKRYQFVLDQDDLSITNRADQEAIRLESYTGGHLVTKNNGDVVIEGANDGNRPSLKINDGALRIQGGNGYGDGARMQVDNGGANHDFLKFENNEGDVLTVDGAGNLATSGSINGLDLAQEFNNVNTKADDNANTISALEVKVDDNVTTIDGIGNKIGVINTELQTLGTAIDANTTAIQGNALDIASLAQKMDDQFIEQGFINDQLFAENDAQFTMLSELNAYNTDFYEQYKLSQDAQDQEMMSIYSHFKDDQARQDEELMNVYDKFIASQKDQDAAWAESQEAQDLTTSSAIKDLASQIADVRDNGGLWEKNTQDERYTGHFVGIGTGDPRYILHVRDKHAKGMMIDSDNMNANLYFGTNNADQSGYTNTANLRIFDNPLHTKSEGHLVDPASQFQIVMTSDKNPAVSIEQNNDMILNGNVDVREDLTVTGKINGYKFPSIADGSNGQVLKYNNGHLIWTDGPVWKENAGEIYTTKNVGIGIDNPDNAQLHIRSTGLNKKMIKLTSNNQNLFTVDAYGMMKCRGAEVLNTNWADFVFEDNYELMSIEEVENFIDEKGHLPNVPSAEEVLSNGTNLGDMDAILLRKIEEMTLYIIELQKKVNELENK